MSTSLLFVHGDGWGLSIERNMKKKQLYHASISKQLCLKYLLFVHGVVWWERSSIKNRNISGYHDEVEHPGLEVSRYFII